MDSTCTSVLARVHTRGKYVIVKHHTVPLEMLIKILQHLIHYKSHGDFLIKYFDYGDVREAGPE